MKTKGINTDEQITAVKVKFTTQEYKEISCKKMINSCFCYGGIEKDGWNFERYISPYIKELGAELFEQVYEEQRDFLEDNCKVKTNVFTDHEGCTYNSLITN